jgi:hypothetical protein
MNRYLLKEFTRHQLFHENFLEQQSGVEWMGDISAIPLTAHICCMNNQCSLSFDNISSAGVAQ